MDSVSQFVLGAALGELTLGRKTGRSSLLLGGALGTLPDLDVLVRYSDAVASFTYHRSWSHSIITLSLFSLLLAWLLYRYFPSRWVHNEATRSSAAVSPSYCEWLLCTWLVLVTHPLLDGFTVYGTQLLWPLPVQPVAWGSLFIIDPLYTLPLLIAVWVAFRHRRKARQAVVYGLVLSTAYVCVSAGSQHHARNVALASLQHQQLSTQNVLIAPWPFSVLWRVVAMDGANFHEGFYSIFDDHNEIHFNTYPTNRALINAQLAHWPIARLDWFTDGLISASPDNGRLIINDLRMGVESSYIFRFDVGEFADNELSPSTVTQQLPVKIDVARMRAIVQRVWNDEAEIPSAY